MMAGARTDSLLIVGFACNFLPVIGVQYFRVRSSILGEPTSKSFWILLRLWELTPTKKTRDKSNGICRVFSHPRSVETASMGSQGPPQMSMKYLLTKCMEKRSPFLSGVWWVSWRSFRHWLISGGQFWPNCIECAASASQRQHDLNQSLVLLSWWVCLVAGIDAGPILNLWTP